MDISKLNVVAPDDVRILPIGEEAPSKKSISPNGAISDRSAKHSSRTGQRRMRTESLVQPNVAKALHDTAEQPGQRMGNVLKNNAVMAFQDDDWIDLLIEYGNNPQNLPAINYAAYKGRLDVVEVLLKHGAKIDQTSSKGTPLEIALREDHLKLASFLIENNAKATIDAGVICCQKQYLNELQMLIKANPQEISKSDLIVNTCCETAFLDGLELVFKNGATIPRNFTVDRTLYHLLSKGDPKYVPIVKFMIIQGANCSYTYDTGYGMNVGNRQKWWVNCHVSLITPALDYDDKELILLLIKNKAPLNTRIYDITRPGDNAPKHFNNNEEREHVLYFDPLYKTVYTGRFETANLLLASGAVRDPWLDTEFNVAAYTRSISMDLQAHDYFSKIKKFNELGFLKQEAYFQSMMSWAINQKDDPRWVSLLFGFGAQVNDHYVQCAIKMKNKEIIKILIDHGAKLP